MKTFTQFFLLFLFINCYTQDYKSKFGYPDINEINMLKYDKDTSAEAVVLFDIGTSNFIRNASDRFEIYFERSTRIKILTDAGVNYGEVQIPFYQNDNIIEQVKDIKGFTYNFENGTIKVTPFDVKQVYEEKMSEYYMVKKFALPNVKAGSVIEFSYSITSPYIFNLQDWSFQRQIPVKYSEYLVKMIPFFAYSYILQGRDKIDVFETYEDRGMEEQYGSVKFKRVVYRFGLKDIPAFNDESLITSINDYIIKIDFQLSKVYNIDGTAVEYISKWNKLCNDLLKEEDFGRFLNAAEGKGKTVLEGLDLNAKNTTEKVEIITNYVKRNFKWNGNYTYMPRKNLRQFNEEKTGGSAELNLYLTGILKSAGIDAHPVLISTRGHGKIKADYPFVHFFNSVIVLVNVDSTLILTDATEPLCKYDEIPPECINEKGLVVKKNTEEWVTLVNNSISDFRWDMELNVTPGLDSVAGQFSIFADDYEAVQMKKKFLYSYVDFLTFLKKNGLEINDSLHVEEFTSNMQPFKAKFNASYPIDVVNEKIMIQPFLNEGMKSNPLKQPKRTYPIDFTYAWSETFHTVINIPSGYKASKLPDPVNVNTLNYQFYYDAKLKEDNTVEISAKYIFKKAVYEPKYYVLLKIFFNDVIKKVNEPVVFEKI